MIDVGAMLADRQIGLHTIDAAGEAIDTAVEPGLQLIAATLIEQNSSENRKD
jgi:hypothetical protein